MIPQILSTLSMSTTLAVVGLAAGVVVGLQPGVATLPHVLEAALVLAAVGLMVIAAGRLRRSALPAGCVYTARKGTKESAIADFKGVFTELTRELVAENAPYTLPKRLDAYLSRLMEYNVPKGKLTRGLTVINAVKEISAAGGKLADEQYRRAAVLGWCVEWLQAFFLVADDIMDESETRRGQPCWYKLDDVKMNAINDGIILEAQIYQILKRYFGSEPLYVPLLELFHEVTLQTALGQFLDLTTADPHKVDFSRFSLDVYKQIGPQPPAGPMFAPNLAPPTDPSPARCPRAVVYKTAFYSFYLPVALGMRLAGITDPTLYVQARAICVEMGEMFQVQDDYLDCYGDPQVTGKVGTDIRDNKCSWLINTALPIASDKQRNVLEANYAKKSDGAERAVRTVYDELDIVGKFRAYEDAANARVLEMIAQVHGMPTTIFTMLLAKIYKRNK